MKSDGKRGKHGKTVMSPVQNACHVPGWTANKVAVMTINHISMNQFLTLGGRVLCNQCQALSSRTKMQCRAPALTGKRVCRTHGGRSTGPKTPEGRARCAQAKTIHGNDSRASRLEHSRRMHEIRILEAIGFKIGMFTGSRFVGRKPKPKE
jgi:hypothetical protein